MSEFPTHLVPANFNDAHINAERYQAMYKRSIEDPDAFWGEMASEFLSWEKPWDKVVEFDFVKGEAAWFAGGKLNVSHNCIDRHLPERADQTALHVCRAHRRFPARHHCPFATERTPVAHCFP